MNDRKNKRVFFLEVGKITDTKAGKMEEKLIPSDYYMQILVFLAI